MKASEKIESKESKHWFDMLASKLLSICGNQPYCRGCHAHEALESWRSWGSTSLCYLYLAFMCVSPVNNFWKILYKEEDNLIQWNSRGQFLTREKQSKQKPTLHFSTTVWGSKVCHVSGIVDIWVLRAEEYTDEGGTVWEERGIHVGPWGERYLKKAVRKACCLMSPVWTPVLAL